MADAADYNLAQEQFPGLNERFYKTNDPSDYFALRQRSLLLTIGRAGELATLLAEGVDYGKLKLRQDEAPHEDQLSVYAATETVVLRHHAAESLIRLALAHQDGPPCPWLEMARLRHGFKERLVRYRHELGTDEGRQKTAWTFLGGEEPQGLSPEPDPGEWRGSVDAVCALLDLASEQLLSEGAMYNAAKHGLGVVSGIAGLSFDFGPESPLDLSVDGPSITYLWRNRQDDKPPRWTEGTTWVHVEEEHVMITLLTQQIKNLWTLARARYLGTTEGVSIVPLRMEHVQATMYEKPDSPYVINTMSGDLIYYRDDPAPPH